MKTPEGLKYAKTDEWIKVEGDEATIGISDFAQDQLSDVVYIEFMVDEGDSVSKGDVLIVLEAMKMENEITAAQAGTVKDIKVRVGDSVDAEDILLVIE